MSRLREFGLGIALLLVLGITLVIYWPGLSGIFLVDDTYTLNQLNQFGGVVDWHSFQAFVLGNESGPLGRPLSMLSFLIDDQYYPGSVESYRFTNVMIHCLCGVALFFFVWKLLSFIYPNTADRNVVVALLGTLWWLITPFNVSTTLYVVQRMAQLSTLFSLIGLAVFLAGRQRLEAGVKGGCWLVLVGLYGFGALAVLGKEAGALIFLFALVVEVALVSSGRVRASRFVSLALLVPLALGLVYTLTHLPALLNDSYRNFTVYERVLTEGRLLWNYAFYSVFPILGKMGLVHDDIVISKSFFSPYTTALAFVAHAIVIVMAWRVRKGYPLLFLAVAWFYVGHSLESTIFPLELYFEHRNYMPSMFLFVVVVSLIVGLRSRVSYFFFALFLVGVALVCLQRTQLWGQPMWQLEVWSVEHPDSKRAQTMYARSLIAQKRYDAAYKKLLDIRDRWPRAVDIDLVLLNQGCWGTMPQVINPTQLYRKMDDSDYYGSLGSIIINTYDLYDRRQCDLINGELMHGVLSRVPKLKNGIYKYFASSQFMDADVYEQERNFGGVIAALDNAYKYQKSPVILYRKAKMLARAGVLVVALEEIDVAIALEGRKLSVKQVDMAEYQRLRSEISGLLNK